MKQPANGSTAAGGRLRPAAAALLLAVILALLGAACSQESQEPPAAAPAATEPAAPVKPAPARPSILLITLDTTRADRLGIESDRVATPALEALAARGVYFSQAYSVTPTTLPSHTSMLTGLYPADHGVRQNGRTLDGNLKLLAQLLRDRGYTTAAFVSAFPLDGRFGLSRGFDRYDDDFPGDAAERRATATTDRALAWLQGQEGPLFLWVHYYDPHEPYDPPEPFRSQYPDEPYLGEIAYMDEQAGRLLAQFEQQFAEQPRYVLVAGDHGEGRGEHGEMLHGNLLYQGTMRVPLIVAGTGIEAGTDEHAVSVRQVFDTVLDWVGDDRPGSLLGGVQEPVLGEALKPWLQYGWQPQFMAVYDGIKVISAGGMEIYDVRADPEETNDLSEQINPDPAVWDALEAYSQRALAEVKPQAQALSQEALDKLASLGYVGSSSRPKVRKDAPRPRDMTHLFHDLDLGAGLFIRQDYTDAIPVFERVLEADPGNFAAALRLAVAYSVTGNAAKAEEYFDRAQSIDPSSIDLRHYRAMHYLQNEQYDLARPLFESVLAEMPNRLPALEGLARILTVQGDLKGASHLLERIVKLKESPGLEWARLGQLRMARHDTNGAIHAFERARRILGDRFTYHLDLGLLYMDARRFREGADSFDRVSPQHPAYPLALYKRAQAAVLLHEPGAEQRVRQAWVHADERTRPLIENDKLFQNIPFR